MDRKTPKQNRRFMVENVTIRLKMPCKEGIAYEVWRTPLADFTEVGQLADMGCPREWVETAIVKAVKGAAGCTVERCFVPLPK